MSTNEPLGAPSSLLHNPGGAKTAPKHDATRPANVGGVTVPVSSAKRDTPETNTWTKLPAEKGKDKKARSWPYGVSLEGAPA